MTDQPSVALPPTFSQSLPASIRTIALSLYILSSTFTLSAANNIFTQSAGDWNNTSNWTLEAIPVAADNTIINNDRVANVNSAVAAVAGRVLVGNQNGTSQTATLNVHSGGSLIADEMIVSAGDPAYLNVLGGDLSSNSLNLQKAAGSLNISSGTYTSINTGTRTVTTGLGVLNITGGQFIAQASSGSDLLWISNSEINITGGTVDITGGQVRFSDSPTINIIGDASTIEIDRVNAYTGTEVTFNLIFDSDGISAVKSSSWLTLGAATINIDGSNYTGPAGSFTLFSSTNLTSVSHINYTDGFEGLKASTNIVNDDLVLTLTESVLEVPAAFLDILPTTGEAPADLSNTSTSISDVYSANVPLSGSSWTSYADNPATTVLDESTSNDENDVIHGLIDHDANGSISNSFEMRIGQGGQIYSITNDDRGEAMPPQFRAQDSTKLAPWIDEAFQMVQVATSEQGNSNTDKYFLHQAGTYQYTDFMAQPFYSPSLLSGTTDPSTYVMANWVQQGHLNYTTGENQYPAKSIVYTKYRLVTGGVVEITQMAFNYGSQTLDHFNIPWGGVRRSTFPEIMVGDYNADDSVSGSFYSTPPLWNTNLNKLDSNGGWCMYAEGTSDSSAAMGVVVGHSFSPTSTDLLMTGVTPQNTPANKADHEWRNYAPLSVIRRQTVTEGDCLFARYYYVFGTVSEVKALIDDHDLVENCTVELINFLGNAGPLYQWRRSGPGAMPSLSGSDPVHINLRDRPANSSFKPVFLIQHGNDYIPTYDPYKYTDNKPYLGSTKYIGLLGYANPSFYDEDDLN